MRMLRPWNGVIVSLLLAGGASAAPPPPTPGAAPATIVSRKPAADAALYYYRAFLVAPSTKGRQLHNDSPQTYPLNGNGLRYLHAAKGALKLQRFGARMPYCNWGCHLRHSWPMAMPELFKAQLLVKIALLDVRYQWSQRNYGAAARDIQDSFILAHRIGRGGAPIGPLVESNIDFEIENVVAENLYSLPPQALANLRRVLDQAAPPTAGAWELAKKRGFRAR